MTDSLRVIRLTHGAGNGIDKACLMTASNMLIGRGQDGDDNSCVCRLLRTFIIRTNDAMPEPLLAELYGSLCWEILGTRTDDIAVLRQRAFAFADWAVREITPIGLRAIGRVDDAIRLESLPQIVDVQTARAAADAADAADFAVDAADFAVDAVHADAVWAAYAAWSAADAAAWAAADAADFAAANAVWRKCPEIIRRVAAIGDKRPVECVITRETLCDVLV